MHRASVVAALAICSAPVAAQANPQDTLHATEIEPVVVRVARGRSSVNRAPFALTITTPDSTRPGQRHSAVDETLALIPGLSVNSRSNPSQDPRLSIRGFGARSAFGVRGIRVLRDGIPLTLPDGQTPLDYMSLESVGHVEVMRGSASALYGNASGGVIDLKSSAPASAKIAADVRQWLGAFGFNRTVVAASGTTNRLYYQGDVSRTTSEGAREHARQRATSLFLRSGFIAGSTEYSASLLGFDMPQAENPGALTLAQMRADPRAADQPSVIKNAHKAAKQLQAALSANTTLSNGTLSGSVFAGARSLDNPLTFGIVEVGRHSQGASGRASLTVPVMSALNYLSVGVDLQSQNDLRRNYANCNESPSLSAPTASCPTILEERGIVMLDQRELVSSAGVYASNEVALGSRLNLTAGVRADQVRFEVEDRMISSGNPDDSGERTMKSVTPIVG
ncbi:MAG TPA: TonB-dependent receptor plug domain-containing protein, partial [Gemmatimonadaceae bacterium]|nr:TonB-dependent receptor plug domain-containing protein [Gemmatimonadaceae bacterium]